MLEQEIAALDVLVVLLMVFVVFCTGWHCRGLNDRAAHERDHVDPRP
jgi:hypothetical protein